jgi:2-polyprenyl-3-methyl-5-hydroxy-6-metoxy-1,4-benzoquinol methylase
MTWCEQSRKFVCIKCVITQKLDHRIVRHRFWDWNNYYSLECPLCGQYHPALDYLEFIGRHPWQLHPDMEKQEKGLDPATEVKETPADYVPLTHAVKESEISRAWNRIAHEWADGYTEYGDLNRQYVIDPVILRMIGRVEGLSALDAGCGNGYLSRLIAKKGACVTGVDISSEFIKMARQKEKESPLGIKYHLGSICNLHTYRDETFDIAVSNLALMDLPELDKAVQELQRVLKRGGKLVFSIMHPCFTSPPVHGWVRIPFDSNRKEDRIYLKVDRYFDRTMEIWSLSKDQPPLYSFHRTLSEYVKTLLRHGLKITDFEEPVPSRKAIREHYREFGDEYDRVPWFLIIGARKE